MQIAVTWRFSAGAIAVSPPPHSQRYPVAISGYGFTRCWGSLLAKLVEEEMKRRNKTAPKRLKSRFIEVQSNRAESNLKRSC